MNNSPFNIILLSLGGIQGVFLFLLLYQKRKVLAGYIFLASYLAVMILQILMKLAGKIWLIETIKPVYFLSYYLPLLYGPLIWLFVAKLTGRKMAQQKVFLHFLPFLFFILLISLSGNSALHFPGILQTINFVVVLNLLSLVIYHREAFLELKTYHRLLQFQEHRLHRETVKWVNQLVVSSFIVCSLISIAIFFLYEYYPRWQVLRFSFSALTLFIYWVSYKAWTRPELFQVIPGGARAEQNNNPGFPLHRVIRKYSNSGLEEEDLQNIVVKLENKIRESRCFLDTGLSIDELSIMVGCSRHHLSQAINKKLGKSFNDFINHYRVEEARLLLNDPQKNSHKIASLAYDAGFNSISTFNEVFKRSTGLTPSQFRKRCDEINARKLRV